MDESKYEYQPAANDIVIYVHGMNMEQYEKSRWTETMFKRLWWQGYMGHVAFLDWPDLGLLNYDRSDYRAYQTGHYFKKILEWLDGTQYAGQVRVLAHSQGNQVVGEALRLLSQSGMQGHGYVHTYVASQAAVAAHAYDARLNNDARFINPPYKPTTPEVMRYYFSGTPAGNPTDVPYYYGNHAVVGKMFRYFNVVDYALVGLVGWEVNNETKPNAFYDFENNDGDEALYTEGVDRFYQSYIISDRVLHMTSVLERYEIFSFCAESRSGALGAVFGPVENFDEFNLRTSGLDYDHERYSHSRQFRSSIVKEWKYWNQFYRDCGLEN